MVRKVFSSPLTFTDDKGGTIRARHVFLHSLILNAQKAFRPNPDAQHDFESWFVTKNEFVRFLTDAWGKGYVLVRARDLFAGKVKLPAGKTPLILSVDDMNYYDYMKGYGFAERTDVDKDGILYPVQTDNGLNFIRDGDVPGVLEQFIKLHPEFSHNGARATIGVTGYEGLLGHRDEHAAAPAVLMLKQLGYEFACHSWGHNHKIYDTWHPHGGEGIVDIAKWLAGVGQVVGPTDLFISPLGVDICAIPILLQFLQKNGFRFFFSIGSGSTVSKVGRCFFADRLNLDGTLLRTQPEEYCRLFGDPEALYDSQRTIPLCPPNDNLSLVTFAQKCLSLKTVYVWDGLGEVLTHEFLDRKEKTYPDFQDHSKWVELHDHVDGQTMGFDCGGLIKRFLMGGFHHFRYRSELDRNAKGLFLNATHSGDINGLPEIPGVCLYMDGHTGIYAGHGLVIESTPNARFGNGVVQTKLSDRPWKHWYFCRGITYPQYTQK